MKSFNCALIGLGAIHMNHVRAIEALPECKLVAVCDIDAAKAEKKAEELNCISARPTICTHPWRSMPWSMA